jgi:haloalkane dehalogenase
VKRLEWDEWPGDARALFEYFRSPAGEEVLETNELIEDILPGAILRDLSEDEMNAYRAPFLIAGEQRRPTLTWPRQLPLDGHPIEVCETIDAYGAYMRDAEMPKLFIEANPGMIMKGSPAIFAKSWKNTKTVTVPGAHFIQEDSADAITDALDALLADLSGQPSLAEIN